ncbi:FecR family protein [Membranihabitans maritimus]|uniref:FecR family protein n=1 Tax=Membranihabitans maritimus TaxID=2904244 RepID=UPI001F25197C|nr:FecR family protein [Membranihabitans maritimus]
MTKEDFSRLIKKYLDGDASQDEIALIEKFYKYFQDKDSTWDWDAMEKKQLENRLLRKINSRVAFIQKKESISKRRYIMGIAATIVVLVVGYLTMYTIGDTVDQQVEEVVVVANNGAKSIFLKDGTYILLKEGSKIFHPLDFKDDVREVRLEGEAWFDVKRDTLRPFKVTSKSIITTVLGTSFNIVAHPEDKKVKVAVTSGKVQVSDQSKALSILNKDESLSYDVQSGSFDKEDKLEEELIQVLQPSEYRMADVSMSEATDFLAERYNREIVYENKKIKECRLFASFDEEDELEDILIIICGISNSRYRSENGRIVISGDGCEKINN